MKKLFDFTGAFSSRDPDVVFYNGKYYALAASDGDSLSMITADRVEDLGSAKPTVVYRAEKGKPYSKQLWAPELHIIDGKCYIYVACDDGNNHNHRMYVLENGSDDPMAPYTMHGKISDESDKWAIDGTVFSFQGKRYFAWSGWEGDVNVAQNLYIAEMKDPYTLSSPRHLISRPEYDWEKAGATSEIESPFINEGPYAIILDGKLYLTYSGAGSWCEDYCIALLALEGEDPLCPSCWKKREKPIFSANEVVKGAGHCSLVKTEEGILVFFHAWEKNETVIEWNRVSAWCGKLVANGETFRII